MQRATGPRLLRDHPQLTRLEPRSHDRKSSMLTTRLSRHLLAEPSLKVGTDKPKQKVKIQSVSDDDVWKRLVEKPCFELVEKGVFGLGRCYIFWQLFESTLAMFVSYTIK